MEQAQRMAAAVQRVGAMGAAQKVLYQADSATAYPAQPFIASVCEATRTDDVCNGMAIASRIAK